MIKTLHYYLARELIRSAFLALIAFTLVMTIFAIIEPLRKMGLEPRQVGILFAYMPLIMLPLTLPIAALFAATIVYGRFAQDNELLACRASGISTVSLLKPAITMGVVVTALSLALSNFTSPQLVQAVELAVKANVKGIVFQQFRSRNYVKTPDRSIIVHADWIDVDPNDPETFILQGVVASEGTKPEDMRILTAPRAYVYFNTPESEGETYATVQLEDVTVTRANDKTTVQEGTQELPSVRLPYSAAEDPSWYNFARLIDVYRNPSKNAQIRSTLSQVRQMICHNQLSDEVISAINDRKPYDKLCDTQNEYVIRAARAEKDSSGGVRLLASQRGEIPRQVEVDIRRGGKVQHTVIGDSGKVQATWSSRTNQSLVAITLQGRVYLQTPGESTPPQRRAEWTAGQLIVPPDIAEATSKISLDEIFQHGQQYTQNAQITKKMNDLRNRQLVKLMGKVKAEMHGRSAYGAACLLLVGLGGALGLIFRGGQLISAFALSILPAAAVIIMIFPMGRSLLGNPKIDPIYGVMAIWGGVVALLVANIVVFFRLSRK